MAGRDILFCDPLLRGILWRYRGICQNFSEVLKNSLKKSEFTKDPLNRVGKFVGVILWNSSEYRIELVRIFRSIPRIHRNYSTWYINELNMHHYTQISRILMIFRGFWLNFSKNSLNCEKSVWVCFRSHR